MTGSLPDPVDEFRLSGRSRLVDQVTHALREMILTHKIPAGALLLQTELASRLGVSRTPLREAMRVLEQDGLVRVFNGNRTVEVVRFSSEELLELYEIREVIDGLAARLLAERGMSREADHEIAGYLHTMATTVRPMQGEAFFTAHSAFHASILLHCGNVRLRSELQLVRMTAASLRDEYPRRVRPADSAEAKANAERTIAEHEAIYEAIRQGEPDLAEQVARSHIRHSFDLIPKSADQVEEVEAPEPAAG